MYTSQFIVPHDGAFVNLAPGRSKHKRLIATMQAEVCALELEIDAINESALEASTPALRDCLSRNVASLEREARQLHNEIRRASSKPILFAEVN